MSCIPALPRIAAAEKTAAMWVRRQTEAACQRGGTCACSEPRSRFRCSRATVWGACAMVRDCRATECLPRVNERNVRPCHNDSRPCTPLHRDGGGGAWPQRASG